MPISFEKVLKGFVLALFFAGGYTVRDYRIHQVPLEFHPVRQYHSAIIARALYYRHAPSISRWAKEAADCASQWQDGLEPPIMEHLASLAYRLRGRERLWMPRLMASIFWLVGGAFLYLLSGRLWGGVGGFFALAFHLFLPYGVLASRSFQPDPLMVMLLLASVYFMVRSFDSPSWGRIVPTLAASALALLVKPQCLPLLFGSYAAVALNTCGLRSALRRPALWLLPLLAFMPSLINYLYRISRGGAMDYYLQVFFRASYFLESSFWLGWLTMIGRVVGLTAFVMGLIGVTLAGKGLPRALLPGLWAGYFTFGLIFNYEIHTHDYYQLQLIPVVALSLGQVAEAVGDQLKARVAGQPRARALAATLLALAVTVVIVGYVRSVRGPLEYADRDQVTIAEEIGERVHHTTRALFLSYAYGVELEYHGQLCGIAWPYSADAAMPRQLGRPPVTVEERFHTLAALNSPEFFIVTEMQDYRRQPQLGDFLSKNFHLLVADPRYLVFDLRQRPH